MPVVKLSLTEDEFMELQNLVTTEGLNSIQDLIRFKLLKKKTPNIFVPEAAVRRALEKYTSHDDPFTLPDIYGEGVWQTLNPRMTGVFGKRFFNYLRDNDTPIEFVGMTKDGRRATYRIK